MNLKFDTEIKKIDGLNWLPWIGKDFNQTKTIILGESHYEDGDEWQKDNYETTRIIIQKRIDDVHGKWTLHNNFEKTILGKDNIGLEERNNIWNSVTYWNLVQRLMDSTNGKSDRPNDNDFDKGWEVFFKLIQVIKPKFCIVLGKASCGRLGYYLNNIETDWVRNVAEFYNDEKIITLSNKGNNLKLIFINHPSGSYGFDYKYWANLIYKEHPEFRQLLNSPRCRTNPFVWRTN